MTQFAVAPGSGASASSDIAGSWDRDLTPAALASLTGLAKARTRRVHLVSQVGFQDCDILPHWLAYYRATGVDDIHLIVHGRWSERRALASACRGHGVSIAEEYDGPYADATACAALTRLIQRFVGDWVLLADADEFVELPLPSLQATMRALRCFGMTSLSSIMVQRVAADGSLPPVKQDSNLPDTFPFANTLLIERMRGNIDPPWKSKHPLFLVHAGTVVRRGNHLAPDTVGISGFGLRAVTHHYKWRASMLSVVETRAQNDPNSGHEKRVVADWLSVHDNRLPMDGAFACSRNELLRRGLLRRPTQTDIATGALLHRIRLTGSEPPAGLSAARLPLKLARLDAAWVNSPREERQLPARAAALAMRPARIAIVTGEITPPVRTGGICTWVSAAAAALRRLGHAITIIYIPDPAFPPFCPEDRELWAARGVKVEVIERTEKGVTHGDSFSIIGIKLLSILEQGRFDLVHLHDAWGYGATVLAAKRQGYALQSAHFVVTAHGPLDWHSRGNNLLQSAWSLRCSHLERLQATNADHMIGPSSHIIEWLGAMNYSLPARLYVHPNPLPHGSWTGRRNLGVVQAPIDRIVFFGRLEPRKGLSLFCDAIDGIEGSIDRKFEVVFLGRPSKPQVTEYVNSRTADWGCRTTHIGNWMSEDALLLLGEPGTLAVIPSIVENFPYAVLECLGAGIPFIATNVGGIPEMVHAEDRGRVLVAPEPAALAEALRRALSEGQAPARPAHDFATVELQWLAWHGSLLSTTPEPTIVPAGNDGGSSVAVASRPHFGPSVQAGLSTVHIIDDSGHRPANR